MVFPLFSHGFPIVFPWFSHGFPMKHGDFPSFFGVNESKEATDDDDFTPSSGFLGWGFPSHVTRPGKRLQKNMENHNFLWENDGKTMGKW